MAAIVMALLTLRLRFVGDAFVSESSMTVRSAPSSASASWSTMSASVVVVVGGAAGALDIASRDYSSQLFGTTWHDFVVVTLDTKSH